ncbi:hypothetical protein Patl1_28740 [Pistacia atlantica]|uniref:Uncharacterized protein n=1 Tax=Pistacia atlantica TaxID=434234 RepID=A0ACC1BGN6_9ROSI|nr:hypothetical protein Patl1_28740 [Pistacia atlantica]
MSTIKAMISFDFGFNIFFPFRMFMANTRTVTWCCRSKIILVYCCRSTKTHGILLQTDALAALLCCFFFLLVL